MHADRLGDDRYVLAADRTRQSFVDRPHHSRRDFGGRDRVVLLGDNLATVIVIVEVRIKFARKGDPATAGVEVYEADQCTPDNIAGALSAMTFAMGRRFVIADGVERWKDSDIAQLE